MYKFNLPKRNFNYLCNGYQRVFHEEHYEQSHFVQKFCKLHLDDILLESVNRFLSFFFLFYFAVLYTSRSTVIPRGLLFSLPFTNLLWSSFLTIHLLSSVVMIHLLSNSVGLNISSQRFSYFTLHRHRIAF